MTKGWLHAPKFGKSKTDFGAIWICRHRKLGGQIKTITIIREGNRWHAAVSTVRKLANPPPPEADPRVVGIDRGVTIPIAPSNGEIFGAAIEGTRQRKRLAQLHQSVARKKKCSANRRWAIAKLAAMKARHARRRKDQLHKGSAQIVKNHDVIVLEDLKIGNMTGSARGTIAASDKQIRQKAGLNREILDRGWEMLGEIMVYKTGWAGKRVIKVARHHSSQVRVRRGRERRCSPADMRKTPISMRPWSFASGASQYSRRKNFRCQPVESRPSRL